MKLVLNSIDGVKELEVNKRPNLRGDTISFSLVVDDTSDIPSIITGDVCTVWTIENLSALALSIGAYVQPLVTYQQTTEVAIKECKFMSELDAIVIDYGSVWFH